MSQEKPGKHSHSARWGLGIAAVAAAAGLLFRRRRVHLTADEEYLAEERDLLEKLPHTIEELNKQLSGLSPLTHSEDDTRRILTLAEQDLSRLIKWQVYSHKTRRLLHQCESALEELEERIQD